MGERPKIYIDEVYLNKLLNKIRKSIKGKAEVTLIIRNPDNIHAESVLTAEQDIRALIPVLERAAIKDAWGKSHSPGKET